MILDSSRESHRYHDALTALLSSDHEQKLLYTLSDRPAIEGMLNILELVRWPMRLSPPRTCWFLKLFNRKESQVASSKLKTGRERRKSFVLLKRMCRAHAKLPSSYMIEDGIETEGSHPCAFGGAADVWKGRYDGRLVAIKSLRIYWPQREVEHGTGKGDKKVDQEIRRLKQVRLFMPLLV